MAERGGQPGNKNATRGAEWRQAIKRALAHRSGQTYRKGLDEVAQKFVEAAANGDAWAIKEIGNRIDGKPRQATEISGPDGKPIQTERIEWTILPMTPFDRINEDD